MRQEKRIGPFTVMAKPMNLFKQGYLELCLQVDVGQRFLYLGTPLFWASVGWWPAKERPNPETVCNDCGSSFDPWQQRLNLIEGRITLVLIVTCFALGFVVGKLLEVVIRAAVAR